MALLRISAVFLALAPPCICAAGEAFDARVVEVAAGDELVVAGPSGRQQVSVYGVASPAPDQPFAVAARQFTSRLVNNATLTIKVRSRPAPGRIVADVTLPGKRNLAMELVKAGYAWWCRPCSVKDLHDERLGPDLRLLMVEEAEARAYHRGLWAELIPIPPWEWRKGRRTP
jgi:micrococcal nuclease